MSCTVLAYARDLFFTSRIERAVHDLGHEVVFLRPGLDIAGAFARAQPAVVVVDLSAPGFEEVITTAKQAGLAVLGFGPHQQEELHRRARAAGAERTVANSKFAADAASLLAPYLA